MHRSIIALAFAIPLVLLAAGPAAADAALSTRLDLDVGQSRELATIESSYRREFAAVRQEHNRQARALRRAKLANDAAETARLEAEVEGLRSQLAALREAQDERIVALLRDDQKPRFDAYVAERRQMAGSSRDERLFD
jgi:seryl-tRNA synthetase